MQPYELAPQSAKERRDEVIGTIIALRGKPLADNNVPALANLPMGSKRTWYLVSDASVDQGGAIVVEGTITGSAPRTEPYYDPIEMMVGPHHAPLITFVVTYPDGRTLTIPNAKICDPAQLGVAEYTAPTEEEMADYNAFIARERSAAPWDDELEYDFPPPGGKLGQVHILMPGGHEGYDILCYGTPKRPNEHKEKPAAAIRTIVKKRVQGVTARPSKD